MASELRVTTIANNAGSESVDTTYVVNGSAKSWLEMNGTGTIATADSLNVSSIADNTTGDYTQNYTTSFSNANYSANAGGGRQSDGEWRGIGFGEDTSSKIVITSSEWNGSAVGKVDVNLIGTAMFGDLA